MTINVHTTDKGFFFETIKSKLSTGKFFTVCFTKADGTERVMNARTGVKFNLKGKGLSYDADKAGNIIVFDNKKKNYRTIKVERLKWIKANGETYNFL